jgi:hypothetical protein
MYCVFYLAFVVDVEGKIMDFLIVLIIYNLPFYHFGITSYNHTIL